MQQLSGRRRGRRPRVSRDQVLDAALQLADEGGLAAVTMAHVGARLGVEAMSLYRHVGNKEEMLDGLVDRVFAEIEVPRAARDYLAYVSDFVGVPMALVTNGDATEQRWKIDGHTERGRQLPDGVPATAASNCWMISAVRSSAGSPQIRPLSLTLNSMWRLFSSYTRWMGDGIPGSRSFRRLLL